MIGFNEERASSVPQQYQTRWGYAIVYALTEVGLAFGSIWLVVWIQGRIIDAFGFSGERLLALVFFSSIALLYVFVRARRMRRDAMRGGRETL